MKIKVKDFIRNELAINPDGLPGIDQCKLARYILRVMALETPRIAAMRTSEIAWPEGEAPK